MTSFIVKQVGKRIFGETLDNTFGAKDPIFEQVPATRLDGKPNGKTTRRRRALPPGISEHDAQILTKVKKRAYRLDMSLFSCCGVKFGWGSVIGIVPFLGDFVDAFLATMVINTAKQVDGGLPSALTTQMYLWVVADLVVGLIPFLGDVADAVLKANSRNSVLLEEHLRQKGKKNLQASGQPIPEVDPSDPHEFDKFQSNPPPEYVASQPGPHGNMTTGRARDNRQPQSTGVTQAPATPARPAQAQVHDDRRAGGGGGFFGFGRNKKSRPADIETGVATEASAARPSRKA